MPISSLLQVDSAKRGPTDALIGRNDTANVQLSPHPDYRINSRLFGGLFPLFGGCYGDAVESWPSSREAYCGAESATHPNITVLPPWPTHPAGPVYCGSTLGHEQIDPSPDPNRILEIYECRKGRAALLIDRRGRAGMELVPLKPGDKVGVPGDCVMTLFALGDYPAVLLDIADPRRHRSNKVVQAECGPSLVLWWGYGNFRALLNPRYVDRFDGYGVRRPRTVLEFAVPVSDNRPESIYRCLMSASAAAQFRLRGIRIRRPDLTELSQSLGVPSAGLRASLETIRKDRTGHALRDALFRDSDAAANAVVFGGGGHVATARLQPALTAAGNGRVDCVEQFEQPLRKAA